MVNKKNVNIKNIFISIVIIIFLFLLLIIILQNLEIQTLNKEIKVFKILGEVKNIDKLIDILGKNTLEKIDKSLVSSRTKDITINLDDFEVIYQYYFGLDDFLLILCDNSGKIEGFYLYRT